MKIVLYDNKNVYVLKKYGGRRINNIEDKLQTENQCFNILFIFISSSSHQLPSLVSLSLFSLNLIFLGILFFSGK